MIMDTNLRFANQLDVSAAAGTAAVGDQADLEVGDRRLGSSMNMALVISVTAAFTSGGAATVAFQLVSDGVAPSAADGSETVHAQTDAIPVAELVVGKNVILPLPAGLRVSERYLGVQVVTATATTTAGSITAGLVLDADDWQAMSDAAN